jgi:2-dehydro-3-deoxyphosphogluconate aldolase/(4S)-4-hydroxy-2-oxoglutarate aldolase
MAPPPSEPAGRGTTGPVVEIPSADAAVALARALLAAGLACAEITLRTAAAVDAISAISGAVPELYLGAGTVLSVAQAETALNAGAQFLVAPNLDVAVVRCARERDVPLLPGVCTPSEVGQARALGLSVVKFFPAEAMGGVAYLKAIAAPFRDVRFVPTGGITAGNLAAYLALPQVVACGGSWMVKPAAIAAGDFAGIRGAAEEALAVARAARPPGGMA